MARVKHQSSPSKHKKQVLEIIQTVVGKMYKKKKQAGGHGPPREPANIQEEEMDIRKIMKDVENFSNSHMTWKDRKKVENRRVVSLGGKPVKNQRLPLSVARPMMTKQKQREQKMVQENMILGRFGVKHSGSSKKVVDKQKPENRGLKLSEGHFRNGVLNVKHLINSAPKKFHDTGMSSTGKRKGGKMNPGKMGGGGGGKKGGGRMHH